MSTLIICVGPDGAAIMIWFRNSPDGASSHVRFRNDPRDIVEVGELFFGMIQRAQLRVNKDPLNMKVVCTCNSIREIEF